MGGRVIKRVEERRRLLKIVRRRRAHLGDQNALLGLAPLPGLPHAAIARRRRAAVGLGGEDGAGGGGASPETAAAAAIVTDG